MPQIDDPKAEDDLPPFLDLKKTLPPADYEARIQAARTATERANRPARPPATPKAGNAPTAAPKVAKGKVAKLPVPPPKGRQSVVAGKKQPKAVAKTTPTEDVSPTGKPPPATAAPLSPKADRKDYPMPTASKKTATRGVTSPAPKTVAPADARAIAKAFKAAKAKGKANGRTAVKGKTTAKKPTVKAVRAPRDGTMTIEILKLASRKQGVSRDELNTLTEWTGAPWKWNFSNPKGTGYCDRFGYKLTVLEGKDGETRYHVVKK